MNKKYEITGMTCSACSSGIERAVGKMEGVASCEVSLMGKSMKVDFDESAVSEKNIFDAVEALGYGIYNEGQNQTSKKDEKAVDRRLFIRFIVSVCILVPLMYVSMGHMLGAPVPWFIDPEKGCAQWFALYQAILSAAIIGVNYRYFKNGAVAVFKKVPNMDTLVALGSGVSFLYSLALTIMIFLGKDAHYNAMNLHFESAAMIEKQYGKGSIMKLGDTNVSNDLEIIPTGCLSLDLALGVGGVPRGRIIEVYGPESSGKTTVALHIIAETQKMGGVAAFIDAEHALDAQYAHALGVNTNELYLSQPDTGEQALDICESLVRSSAVDVIVIDSVAALTPKAEIEGDMGDTHVGLLARLMSQALRKLTAITNRSKTCVIFINQLREKVGVMFGNPETTPGGKALKYFATIRLDIRKADALKGDGGIIGNRAKCKVVKNKVAPPFKVAEFDIIYGEGVSQEGCLIDLGVEYGILTKSGSWFNYGEEKVAQGREKMRELLRTNQELKAEIEAKIREAHKASLEKKD